jgi:benzoyl-CoA 2,3-dioxygenase component A
LETVLNQHVIDPEICIRCNTCEDTCPIDAVTHDANNYVVDPEKCDACMDCLPPCPTGAIDNWRRVPRAKAYSIEEQFSWDELPQELTEGQLGDAAAIPASGDTSSEEDPDRVTAGAETTLATEEEVADFRPSGYNALVPPWSAAHGYTNLYGPKRSRQFITARVSGNFRVTAVGSEYDTHHIVLDFGNDPFPVLEGQSIGILPPGVDAAGKPHHARQYSVASARNGERPGYNNLSLTIKRVLEDYDGNPVRGVGSNYMCDLAVGDEVRVVGPFGATFLMPNHPRSGIVMICTGTGSAPMRAMTEWRRRLRRKGHFEGGKLMLFFGARTPEELPYFGPLQNLPKDFIDINFAFSRQQDKPRRYVQDVMRERAADLAPLLRDPDTCFYVCGIRNMEEGVMLALRDIVENAGDDWETIGRQLRDQGRLHLETY